MCVSLPLPEARSGAQRPPSPVQTLPLPSRVNVQGGCTSVRVAFGPHGSSRCHGRERLSSPPPYPGVKFQAVEKAEVSRPLRSENPGPRESGVGTGGAGWGTHPPSPWEPQTVPRTPTRGVQVRIRCENIINPSGHIHPLPHPVGAQALRWLQGSAGASPPDCLLLLTCLRTLHQAPPDVFQKAWSS